MANHKPHTVDEIRDFRREIEASAPADVVERGAAYDSIAEAVKAKREEHAKALREAEVAQSNTLMCAPSADEVAVALEAWLACEEREVEVVASGEWQRACVETIRAQCAFLALALTRYLLGPGDSGEVCAGVTVRSLISDHPLQQNISYQVRGRDRRLSLYREWDI